MAGGTAGRPAAQRGTEMRRYFRDYLFQKHILVAERKDLPERQEDEAFAVLFALASLFGVRITEGEQLATRAMISFVSQQLGENVPEPFYRGFPESVRELCAEELLYDQLLHYIRTYGLGDFSEAGHSVYEETFERTAFREGVQVKNFVILDEDGAERKMAQLTEDLLAGTRPLSEQQYAVVLHYLEDFGYQPPRIASKNTAVRLLLDLRDPRLARHLMLSDVIRLTEELQYRKYHKENIRSLNLQNRDRKFLTEVMETLFEAGRCDTETCFEKRDAWNGLLHHLHYRPKTEAGRAFTDLMRGKENRSVYAAFERHMAEGDVREALLCLQRGKGSGAVLRNLQYLLSRCGSEEDVAFVLHHTDTRNVIVLLQLLIRYGSYDPEEGARAFTFSKFNRLLVHQETEAESTRRRSRIGAERAQQAAGVLYEQLRKAVGGSLGKVYIDPDMRRYALPLQESTSQGGYGVLPKGTRLPIGEGKIIRAFTYWEGVDDIDLSVIGIDGKGGQTEFSWRTMALRQMGAITYSGDQTSGFYGGSEYFDIHAEQFRKRWPAVRYLILCDNVYSDKRFSDCLCKAGYMVRDKKGSGKVFEPKTVRSAFRVDCDSRFAYLFGIDLETREFVWLNEARNSGAAVAGTTSLDFLKEYFHTTEVMNQYTFFELLARETVGSPEEAEVIVTDKDGTWPEGAEVIREYDFEKTMALMNGSRG